MAIRIVGVDLPQNKRGEVALTYIYGIGRSSSAKILDKAGVDKDLKVKDWTDDQAAKIREIIGAEFKVEGDLRSEIQLNIKRLMDIGCIEGDVKEGSVMIGQIAGMLHDVKPCKEIITDIMTEAETVIKNLQTFGK